MSDDQRMSGEEILAFWQTKRGQLSAQMQKRFLERWEVEELQALPGWAVQAGLHRYQKLLPALGFARQHATRSREADAPEKANKSGDQKGSSNRNSRGNPTPARSSERSKKDNYRLPGPQSRPSKRDGSSLPPLVRGVGRPEAGRTGGAAGSRSTYASGLAHNPGAVESPVGERCSGCHAFVPSGAAHDCT